MATEICARYPGVLPLLRQKARSVAKAKYDDMRLEFNCPACGEWIKETYDWFKGLDGECPHCREKLRASSFAAGLAEFEALMKRDGGGQ